ncbi:hypothetical protein KSP39_PZI003369 [Platanthera zijinensis]|uniref:Uncharacterized protein n=1 Tax=Platanthera zijinensis TaxID=2320716 RepID=A0AAP0BWN2_9ASPA
METLHKVESVGEMTGALSPASSEQDAALPDPGEMDAEDESPQLGGDPTDPASPEVPAFVGYCGMGAVLGASAAMINPPGGLEEEDLSVA